MAIELVGLWLKLGRYIPSLLAGAWPRCFFRFSSTTSVRQTLVTEQLTTTVAMLRPHQDVIRFVLRTCQTGSFQLAIQHPLLQRGDTGTHRIRITVIPRKCVPCLSDRCIDTI